MPDGLDQYLDQFVPRNPKVDSILDRMRDSVITQESGGDPKVKNARTSATGLFQVMPANIPSWTKSHYGKSLTPEQFASDVNAQEKVFRGEMGKYVNKALQKAKGDEDLATRMAAAAWYGGEGAMHRYDDPTKFRPNEPSFQEYTTSILGRIKKGQIKSQGLDKYLDQFTPQSNEGLDSYLDQFVDTPPAQNSAPADNYGAPALEAQKQLEGAPVVQDDPVTKRLADLDQVRATTPQPPPTEEQMAELERLGIQAQNNAIDPTLERQVNVGEFLGAPAYHFGGAGTPQRTPLAPKQAQKRPTARGGVDVSVGEPAQAMPQTGGELGAETEIQPFTRRVIFDQKPANKTNKEFLIESLIPEIASKTGFDAIDIQKHLEKGIEHESGTPIEDAPWYDFTLREDDIAALSKMAEDKYNVLSNFTASGQPLTPQIKEQLSQEYGLDPREIESAVAGENPGLYEAGIRGKANRAKYDAQLKRYKESMTPGESPATAEIRARRDMGWTNENSAESQIAEENENYQRIIQEERDAWLRLRNIAYSKTGRPSAEAVEKDVIESANQLIAPYGSATAYVDKQNKLKAEFGDKPFLAMKEAGTNAVKAVPQMISGGLKSLSIAAEGLDTLFQTDRKDVPANKRELWYAAQSIDDMIKRSVSETSQGDPLLDVLPNTFGQIITQVLVGHLTGGASAPALLGAGQEASAQYEDALKYGATQDQRLKAAGIAALLAVPDYFIFRGMLKGASVAQKSGFVRNLYDSVKTRLIGSGIAKAEAEALAGTAADTFIQSWAKKGIKVLKSGTGEGVQEVSATKGNDLTAYLTYDPSPERLSKLTTWSRENTMEAVAGFFGGVVGASVGVLAEKADAMDDAEFKQAQTKLEELKDTLPPEVYDRAKKAFKVREAVTLSPEAAQPKPTETRVSTPKGEGIVIEDRGNKVLVEFNDGQSVAEFRKNQIAPAETSVEVDAKTPTIEAPNVREIGEKKQTTETPNVPTFTEKEVLAPSTKKVESPRTPARRMVIEPKDGGPAIYPESRKGVALKSVADAPKVRKAPDTPEFRKFFEGSKVVDEKGEPLVVYHGTSADFDTFKDTPKGVYFSPHQEIASAFAQGYDDGERGANVRPVYLSLKNPLTINRDWLETFENQNQKRIEKARKDSGSTLDLASAFEDSESWARDLVFDDVKKTAHDGLIIESDLSPASENMNSDWELARSYVAFKPTQIKSAIGNQGTFDPNDPSILKKARDAESTALLPKLQNEGTAKILSNLKGGKVADNGDLEINEHESEQIRRLLAEKHFQETGTEIDERSFDAITWSEKQVRDLVELGRDLVTDFKRGGYTDAELTGYYRLLDNLEDSINKAKDYAVAFVFDDALPEEKVHQEDLRAGRTDAEALDTLKSNPLWKGSEKFNRDYSNVSDADRASEIAAKLLTGQEKAYGFDSIEDFETHKTAFLNDWADGILRKNNVDENNVDEFIAKYKRIGQYATLATNNKGTGTEAQGSERPGGVSQETVRGDEEKGFQPAGKEKVSKTPSTLRKNDIPVQDRSYISVTNPDQQEFADNQLNKGLDKATEWFDEQIADNNLNNGATTVVGLNLLNQLGKKGMIKEMNEVADKLVPFITEAAQSVQAVATVSMFNPENAGAYAAKVAKQHGTELTDKGFKKAEELAKNLNETAQVDAFADRALADAENHLIDVREDIEVSIEAGRIARGGADVSLDLESANKVISDLRKKIEQLQNKKPKKSANKNIAELEAKEDKILAAIQAKYGHKEDAPLKSVSFSDNDPDLVDWATLTLNRHLKSGDMSVGTFYNELNKLTNGQLTEEQIGDIHAEAVSKIKVVRTIGPDKRLAQQLRNEHYRASEAHINRYDIQIKQMLNEQAKRLREQAKDAEKSEKETEQARAKKNITRLKAEIAAKQSEIAAFKAFEKEEIKQAQKEVREMVKEMNKAQRSVKAQDKFVSAIIDEGIKGDFSDEAIFFALARKSKPKVEDAMAEFKKEYGDVDKKIQRQIMADAENIFQRAKKAVADNVLQAKNDFQLTEEDIERIKEEKRFNQSAARKIKLEADRFYSGLSQTTGQVIADTAVNFRRANLLTGVKTHLRNMAGNTAFGVSEEISRIPSSIADIGASLLTGQRTVQGVSPTAIINGFNNIIRRDETFKNLNKDSGKKAAWDILNYGDTLDNLEKQQHQQSLLATKSPREGKEKKFELFGKERSISTDPAKWMDNYINGVFRTLGAEDALFKTYAFRRALEEEAYTQALSEKRVDKSVNVKERQKELIKNPTFVMQKIADDYATFATFQNDNAISTLFTKFKKLHPGIKAVAEIVVPYDRTPTNIVLRVLEHAPVIGTGIAVKKALDMRKAPDKKFQNEYAEAVRDDLWDGDFEALAPTVQRQLIEEGIAKVWSRQKQREFAKTFGRQSWGTALFGTGYLLASLGLLTGSMAPDDDDKEETKEFFARRKKGIENKSLHIPGVGRFVLTDDPAMKIMAAGATLYEQSRMSKSSGLKAAWDGIKETTGDMLTEQPLLSNMGQLYRVFSKGKVGEYLGSTVSGFFPASAMVGDIAEISDEKSRTVSGFKDKDERKTIEGEAMFQLRGFKNSAIRRIPLLRTLADESKDAFPKGDVLRRAVRAIDLFNTRPDIEYDVNDQKDKSAADKVRSGDMSVSDAKTELKKQLDEGKITRKTYKTRIKDLENDTFEKSLKEMNAAKDDDFTKIEAFLKEVPDSRMEDARKILRQKRANKLKDNSPKAREDARKLQELMVKYLARKARQEGIDGYVMPQREQPEFVRNIERRWASETPVGEKWANQRSSKNIEDRRWESKYPVLLDLRIALNERNQKEVQEILKDAGNIPMSRQAHDLIHKLLTESGWRRKQK